MKTPRHPDSEEFLKKLIQGQHIDTGELTARYIRDKLIDLDRKIEIKENAIKTRLERGMELDQITRLKKELQKAVQAKLDYIEFLKKRFAPKPKTRKPKRKQRRR